MEALFLKFGELAATAKDNLAFLGISVLTIVIIFVIALAAEKLLMKERKSGVTNARYMAICGMMSAIAMILMLFEIPLFFAPEFYKIDFSEVPVLIGTFSLGPVAGVIIELCKIVLKVIIKGTTTAFVGDLANFIIGCTFIIPASVIYHVKKTKKSALIGMSAGTLMMTIFGSIFNAVYLLPKFAQLYGLPLDQIVAMGNAVNSNINSVTTLALFAVVPFNLLKGVLVTLITMFLYKRISPLLKSHRG